MPTLTRYVVDFTTPLSGPGVFAFALTDFVADIRIGTVSQIGKRGVDRQSTVVANLCEMASAPGHGFEFPFIGSASMEVRNVAPRDDGIVSLRIHIDWNSVLNLRLLLLVVND